jgi:hypothetical protein
MKGIHRIRHYGLFASGVKAENLAKMRDLLGVAKPEPDKVTADEDEAATPESTLPQPCPCCGSQMRIIETFAALPTKALVRTGRDRQLMTSLERRQSIPIPIPRPRSPHRNDGARIVHLDPCRSMDQNPSPSSHDVLRIGALASIRRQPIAGARPAAAKSP